MSDVVERLHDLGRIGRNGTVIDRALATPAERQAREFFARWSRDAGLALSQDAVGNLFARRAGAAGNGRVIMTGSHLDTVPTGGAYDGAYGVAASICALELLQQRGVETAHAIEAVAWAGEEGSRFPLGCLGSSVFAGLWSADDALELRDALGVSLGEALRSTQGGLLPTVALRDEASIAAYLELHVEQGPVLEAEGVHLGVVTAIAGQRRYRFTIEGPSGHAGTVPMRLRADPLGAAAEIVLAAESAARKFEDTVATVGRMVVVPGGTNVIPARVECSLDVRSGSEERVEAVEAAVREAAERAGRERRVRVGQECLEARPPAPMNEAMRAAVHRAIASLGVRAIDIASGAGHDAMCVSRVAPAAMIFVPSIGGRSHVGEERTADEDLRRGVEALAASLVEVDRMLAEN